MNENNDFDQFSSQNAEQSVLGALMSRNEVLDDFGFLKQEHFADDANRLIFNVICKQIAHGKTSDPISIFDALQSANRLDEVGGMEYINALATSVTGGYAARHWAQILVDKYQLRAVRNMAVALNEAVCKRGMSGEEAVEEAMRSLMALEQSHEEQVHDGVSLAKEVLADVQKRFDGHADDGMKTGFSVLDSDVMLNGIERGQLVVIAGRTSMGKSAFANTLALNMARDYSVLTVSYEMTKKQLSRRSAATLGRIPQKFLQVGFNENDDDTWERLTVATDELSRRKYGIAEHVGRTALGVASMARKYQRKRGLDVLVVDHLGLMQHDVGKGQNTASAIGETTRQLKQLAQDLNIAVVLLVQVNRTGAGEVKKPSLTDLRDSGRIEEDADVVMLLHRDDYYREESKKSHDGLTNLICAKVRDGEQKTVYLKFLGQFSMFEDWVGEIPTAQPVEQKPSRGFGYGQQRGMAA